MVNSERIKTKKKGKRYKHVYYRRTEERTRMYSHFVTTCLCEWPFFLFIRQMDLYHCYLFFCLKIYERTHCPHHWQTTWLSGIDAGTIQAKDAGSNGLTSIGETHSPIFYIYSFWNNPPPTTEFLFSMCTGNLQDHNNKLKIITNEKLGIERKFRDKNSKILI